MFFRFPPDARWNPERSVVEFGIGIGEYLFGNGKAGRVIQSRSAIAELLNESGAISSSGC